MPFLPAPKAAHLAALRGVTATGIIADAQARGVKASDVLAELLEQAGIEVDKVA